MSDIAQKDGPGKGCLCYWLANIVASDEHLPRNSFEWVSRDDILRVCAAFTHVLSDPRTEEESNGWVYMSIDTIANHLRWAQLLCDNIVEPARRAAIADNVDTSHVGDFPVLLLYLSRTLAKAKTRLATGVSWDQLGCFDDDDDGEEYILRQQPVPGEWTFFLEVFRRNSNGFPLCRCSPREPQLYCEFKKSADLRREIGVAFTCLERIQTALIGQEGGDRERTLSKIIEFSNKVLGTLHKYTNFQNHAMNFAASRKSQAFLIRGKAYRALGRLNDALDDFDALTKSMRTIGSVVDTKAEAKFESIEVMLLSIRMLLNIRFDHCYHHHTIPSFFFCATVFLSVLLTLLFCLYYLTRIPRCYES